MKSADTGIVAEWRKYGILPFAAMLGYSTSSLYAYSFGAFVEPIQSEFGWTRTQAFSGLTITNFALAFLIPLSGPLIDRFGPRRVGLTGLVIYALVMGSLGLSTGSLTGWWIHWFVLALATLGVQGAVWTSAVVTRFHAGRGGAIAITVSGSSIAIAILPLLATYLIDMFGWRAGYMLLPALWLALAWPALFLFFRGAHEERAASANRHSPVASSLLPGATVKEAFRQLTFYKIIFVALAAAFTTIGTAINFIPIVQEGGRDALGAAGFASLVGFSSIFGRVGMGFLLDRLPAHRIGAIIYLMPLAGSLALLIGGNETAALVFAAVAFGLAMGAEADVVIYLLSAHLGLRSIGTLMSAAFGALALGSALGPLAASAIYDTYQDYSPYLWLVGVLTAVATLTVLTLKTPDFAAEVR